MSKELFFKPFPLLSGPHLQTIFGSLSAGSFRKLPAVRKLISLPDGDQLSVEVTTPRDWQATDLTAVMIHGLCGSHQATYLIRMAARLSRLKVRAVRLNLRGCGSGRGLARQFYHGGQSEDVRIVLKALKEESPLSPITLIGFSLGGNIALKLAGELRERGKELLQQVIAVSPPTDLLSSVERFALPENAFYERRFFRQIKKHVCDLHRIFNPDAPPIYVPDRMKMREFDELFTAPRCGFANALDYYVKCSSKFLVLAICIPCKILLSEDDPVVSPTSLDGMKLPDNVQVFKTKKGGHMGYLGHLFYKGGLRFLDHQLMEWVLRP